MEEQLVKSLPNLAVIIGICVAVGMVIILLVWLYWKHIVLEKTKLKKYVLMSTDVDFSNVIDSSFQAKPLYDSLKIKCHPDRFLDEQEKLVATEIFSLLVKYQYDYKVLLELRERAIQNLNIKL